MKKTLPIGKQDFRIILVLLTIKKKQKWNIGLYRKEYLAGHKSCPAKKMDNF